MCKYNNGKIYKLVSSQTDEVYIGSTTQSLKVRLSKHKCSYRRYQKGQYSYMTSYKLCQYDDVQIKLVKRFPCNSKKELEKYEGKWIKTYQGRGLNIVNKIIAGRTYKEWYELNKESLFEKQKEYHKKYQKENKKIISEKQKQYYKENKDKIAQRQNWKIDCECGGKFTKANKAQHLKSKKHQNHIREKFV